MCMSSELKTSELSEISVNRLLASELSQEITSPAILESLVGAGELESTTDSER